MAQTPTRVILDDSRSDRDEAELATAAGADNALIGR
jgi:hypothetical protein